MVKHVLIVDDEPDIRELLEITLARMQLETYAAANVRQAKQLLENNNIELCLTDMRLPDGDGLELVEHIQQKYSQIPVAVITAHGSMEAAIQALKLGAFDFVSKPIDLKMLRGLVDSALKLAQEPAPIQDTSAESDSIVTRLLGDSQVAEKLRQKIHKLARSQAPVYLHGESGVGKELVARQIHAQGPRSDSPFIPVNCGAIPNELMESEFFGHLKGSFTGATQDKQGLFAAAESGTLFLDEVAELPMHMQVKLLRAIQEKAIKPVGGQHETPMDVRILSATHKDLLAEIDAGNFRQDLYYRINVIELQIPPLRERIEDLPVLIESMLARLAIDYQLDQLSISDNALEALSDYHFPGNIRELENILERAAALCEDNKITASDIELPKQKSSAPSTENKSGTGTVHGAEKSAIAPSKDQLEVYLQDKEKQAIVAALEKTRWNKTAAAKLLGISFRQLRYRLKKLDLE